MAEGTVDSLLRFLTEVEALRGREETSRVLDRLLKDCGFAYYRLMRRQKPASNPLDLLLAGRSPEGWDRAYVDRRYFQIDPTVRRLDRIQTGFRWRDALPAFRASPQRRRMERMMADARRHGLEDGYSFPVHGRRGLVGSLAIGGRPRDLCALEMTLFDAVARKLFWKMLHATAPEEAEKRLECPDPDLTVREVEILALLAEGLTSRQIADLLGITGHTVNWYMNAIQRKLGARNRHHAIALAFRRGLVS